MFSSIPEERRPEVIERCYWPLLRMVEESGLPIGIEASGVTLELIENIDPEWTHRLGRLIADGGCEFVGSGYAQLIGPLVPAAVNQWNLKLGNDIYARIVGRTPRLALINEQAYSAGLVPLYLDAGYQGVIMEWGNPALANPEWPGELKRCPQRVLGSDGRTIPVIWNDSIAFQQFQRHAHDESTLEDYLRYVREATSGKGVAWCAYGNDAEVFDFRPGRFGSEAVLPAESEWMRVRRAFEALSTLPESQFVSPSEILRLVERDAPPLRLESPRQPIPVKKQPKYNVTRWGLSGRDDIGLNTLCRRLSRRLERIEAPVDDWKELCLLWSSDFRTHITQSRWDRFCRRIATSHAAEPLVRQSCRKPHKEVRVPARNRLLEVKTGQTHVRLNRRRGLALAGVSFPRMWPDELFGTLDHGFFDEIDLGADFYSGHLIYEAPGSPKLTDLVPVEPDIDRCPDGVRVSADVRTALFGLHKEIFAHETEPRLDVTFRIDGRLPTGSLRLGHVTLLPEAFNPEELYFATHNGGREPEVFRVGPESFDHGRAVSFMVSSSCALGLTEGVAEIGDGVRALRLSLSADSSAVLGMIGFRRARRGFYFRFSLSLLEMDETSLLGQEERRLLDRHKVSLSISPLNNSGSLC